MPDLRKHETIVSVAWTIIRGHSRSAKPAPGAETYLWLLFLRGHGWEYGPFCNVAGTRTRPRLVTEPSGYRRGMRNSQDRVTTPPTETDAPPRRSPWGDALGRAAIRSGQLVLVALALAVVIVILVRLRLVVVPVTVAVMLAAAVWPLVGWLRARGVPNIFAAWAALLTGAAALGGLGWLVVSGIRREWSELRDGAAEGVREVERRLSSGALPIDSERIDQGRDALASALSGGSLGAGAVTGAVLVAEIITGVLLSVVVLFFLLEDGPKIWGFFRRAVPADRLSRFDRAGARSLDVLGGYIRGTTIIALVDAVAIGLALVLLGVPLALPLATIVFLGAYIPLLGAVVAGAVAALIALVANGPVTALIVVGVVILVNQVEGDVLAPLVLGKALSLHPLAVLLALTGGAILAGVIGALLAVPTVAVIWAATNAWNEEREQEAIARDTQVLRPTAGAGGSGVSAAAGRFGAENQAPADPV